MWAYPGHFETHQWPVLSGHFLTPWSMSLLLFFCSPDSRTLPTTHSLGANPSFHFSDNHLFSLRFLHVPLNASSYTPLKGLFPYVLNPSLCGFYFQPIMLSPHNLIHYLQSPNTLPLSSLPLSAHFYFQSATCWSHLPCSPDWSPLSLGILGLSS